MRKVASAGVVSTAGCLSLFEEGDVALYVVNWCQEKVDIEVLIRRTGGGAVFEREYELSPNEDVKVEDVAKGGRYDVRATLDGTVEFDYDFAMGECENQTLVVRADDCERVVFGENVC